VSLLLLSLAEDFDWRKSDGDRYSSSLKPWKDPDKISDSVQYEFVYGKPHTLRPWSAEYQSDVTTHQHHGRCSSAGGSRYDHHHDHAVSDVQIDSYDPTLNDDRPHCVDYDDQLRRHGWRTEVHGDPFNLKCVVSRGLSLQAGGVIGVGAPPPNIREKYFSGNYYGKFGHFAGKNSVKFGNFVDFSDNKNSGILIFFFGQKSCKIRAFC